MREREVGRWEGGSGKERVSWENKNPTQDVGNNTFRDGQQRRQKRQTYKETESLPCRFQGPLSLVTHQFFWWRLVLTLGSPTAFAAASRVALRLSAW